MTKLARFRFSLATMLLMVAWSAAVVRMNTTPRFTVIEIFAPKGYTGNLPGPYTLRGYGWPWACASYRTHLEWSCRALVGDAVVAVLLVTVLTWSSRHLWRRIKRVFCPAEPPLNG